MLPEDRPVGGYCKDAGKATPNMVRFCCQRIDPLEGTASSGTCVSRDLHFKLPEDRPVGGYCKLDHMVVLLYCHQLPEDRPVGGYCKDDYVEQGVDQIYCCQRIDPLEGTARGCDIKIVRADGSCQRIDPLEGTASIPSLQRPCSSSALPEDRPVGGYCKCNTCSATKV